MRRTTLVGVSLLCALTAAAPATAVDGTNHGTADAEGLALTIAGQGLTIGASQAAIETIDREGACEAGVLACATGAGAAGFSDSATATAPGEPGPTETTAFALPEDFNPLLDADLGIATAVAGETPPAAGASGTAFELALNATQTLAGNVPVQDVLDAINEQVLGPIAANDPSGVAQRLSDSVSFLSGNLADSPILRISGGVSRSDTDAVGGVTHATAAAAGATIVVVPTPGTLPAAGDGLVVIEVGAATARAVSDGAATEASFDPAIVRVKFLDPATGEYAPVVTVAPGQSQCTPFAGTPLEPLTVCVTAGSGATTQEGGVATAEADGVELTLFSDPLPAVRLQLAGARVSAAATQSAAPAPPPLEQLPRTGGGAAILALGTLALGAALLPTRRRASS